MIEITYNAELCKKCGLCATACPLAIPEQKEKGTIPTLNDSRQESCFRCGHCVAVCPQGAISHSHFPKGTVTPIKPEQVPSYDQVLELVRSRRSKRRFKEQPVERDMIEKVLEAARFAPSGHNKQTTEFIVVQDKEIIYEIGKITAASLKSLGQAFRSWIGRMIMRRMFGRRGAETLAELAPELEGLADLYNSGTDWILNEAPVLLFFCADSAGGYGSENANLAVQNAALAAETIGLGCFYSGFVGMANGRSDKIAELVSLPETHEIYGTLAMGYPRLKYSKWVERNPAKVTWVGFD
jgi:nitroreductase/Pyruvate/2-oxoacid:ferredoxin oxidoreductase delta subunit